MTRRTRTTPHNMHKVRAALKVAEFTDNPALQEALEHLVLTATLVDAAEVARVEQASQRYQKGVRTAAKKRKQNTASSWAGIA